MKKNITIIAALFIFNFSYAQTTNTFPSTGNVGIGTTNPFSQLGIAANNSINPNTTGAEIPYSSITFQNLSGSGNFTIGRIAAIQEVGNYVDAAALAFSIGRGGIFERMCINTNGNVLIGKTTQTNSSYLLDVAGNVRANQIVVNTSGADFVFDPLYKLASLNDLEKYINQNHHLPDIASSREMQTNGINLAETQTKLLQKVEELTLYIIEQKKQQEHDQDIEKKQQAEIELLKQQVQLLIKNDGKK